MVIHWRQLLLVVLVSAIAGGAAGFIGHQVGARMERIEVARQQVEIDRYIGCKAYDFPPERSGNRISISQLKCIPPDLETIVHWASLWSDAGMEESRQKWAYQECLNRAGQNFVGLGERC